MVGKKLNDKNTLPGVDEFLSLYPKMVIVPTRNEGVVLNGLFEFAARFDGHELIQESFSLRIEIPKKFPTALPKVLETSGKIRREEDYHINGDGTLCLGSPIKLRMVLSKRPDLVGFAERCLIPHLYSISYKIRYGKFPFGELDHRIPGLVQEYKDLFGLKNKHQIVKVLELLGMKKRIANKRGCPCECGFRLGKCSLRRRINSFRKIASRSWYKSHLEEIRR